MKDRVRVWLIWLGVVGLALAGCGKFSGVNSKTAIKEAVDTHLKQQPGLALANMTTEVQDVKFDGDHATAQVVFQSKEAPELKVEVRYTLRRQGNRWEVESSTPMGGAGANPHGAAAMPPAGQQPQTVPANPHSQMSPQASH
jgi:hypothetical protein